MQMQVSIFPDDDRPQPEGANRGIEGGKPRQQRYRLALELTVDKNRGIAGFGADESPDWRTIRCFGPHGAAWGCSVNVFAEVESAARKDRDLAHAYRLSAVPHCLGRMSVCPASIHAWGDEPRCRSPPRTPQRLGDHATIQVRASSVRSLL